MLLNIFFKFVIIIIKINYNNTNDTNNTVDRTEPYKNMYKM